MSRFIRLVKIMLVTSHRDVIAAFKARILFLAINLEILCNLYIEKCENNAYKNSDTFDGWFCEISVLSAVLLNASSTCHQRSFRLKDLLVTFGIATVQ